MPITRADIDAAENIGNYKERFLKELERIEGLPDMQRWRGIKDLLLKLNPKIKRVDDEFCKQVLATRNEQLNEFGASANMHMRQLIDMPAYLYQALIMADQNFNYNVNICTDREVQKATWRKMTKCFPEYAIARTI